MTPPPIAPDAARARRLARAIASDLWTYQPDKVAEGVAKDTFFAHLAPELEAGLALYKSRVDAAVDPGERQFWWAVVDVIIAATGHIDSPMW